MTEGKNMVQIKCNDVSLGYDGKNIVEHLDFEIESGDFLCIVGDNGSGKTTLMKALLGLKKVSSGSIDFADRATGRRLGYLPQQSDERSEFPATVEEVVLSGLVGSLGTKCFFSRSGRKTARENLYRLGISDLAKKPFSKLSGGQRQRALLARALCAVEDMILLDEPVSGLDPAATEDMYELICELNKNHGVTVIMITHDIDAAVRYANKVLYIGKEPSFFTSVDEYVASPVFPARKEA